MKGINSHFSIHLLMRAVLLVIIVLFAFSSCSKQSKDKLTDIRLGVAKQPSSALVHIALANNYFLSEDLKVKVEYFPSGKRALVDGLLSGQSDYITTSDIPFVWKSFSHSDLMILASIYNADNINRIISRNDAEIHNLGDLRGKKVATQKQSAVHFFLHSVLIDNQIKHEDVQLSFFKAGLLPQKLASAEIDAFSMREPYISQAKELLGKDKVTVFSSPGLYVQTELLVARKGFIERHSKVNKSLLRALLKAETFAQQHPEQAINIVAKTLGLESQQLSKDWKTFELAVNFEHSLLLRLEQQASWFVEAGLVTNKIIPDYRERIYAQPLIAVKPEAMLIIK